MPAQLLSQASASTSYDPAPKSLLTTLRAPFASLADLETLLLDILTALDAVPASFSSTHTHLTKHDVLPILPTIQHLLLSVLLPTWLTPLHEADRVQLAQQLFCPAPDGNETRCSIVMAALPTVLAHLPALRSADAGPRAILQFCLDVVEQIASTHPLDVVYRYLFAAGAAAEEGRTAEDRRARDWEDYVRAACSVPGKVANALHERTDVSPRESLEHGAYFSAVCCSTSRLISHTPPVRSSTALPTQTHLLLKLITLGLFPPAPPALPSQPSFFAAAAPTGRENDMWPALVRALPATAQQTLVASLVGALQCSVGLVTGGTAHARVRGAAGVLRAVLGPLEEAEEDGQLWGSVRAVVCGTASGWTWDMGVVRAVVWWVAAPQGDTVNERALEKLLDSTLSTWTDPTFIRHSLLAQHRYTSTLLLLTLSAAPTTAQRLALSPPFIAAISTYLAHLDGGVRRCGMLVAEVVAQLCGKTLAFEGWEGEGEGREWAREVRAWRSDWSAAAKASSSGPEPERAAPSLPSPPLTAKPQPARPPPAARDSDSDSDDSLTGYASPSPTSSRAPSPTPSALAEMEADPTIRPRAPPPRPVYLAQLAALLRADDSEEGAAERIAVGLAAAAGLVRRKKGFGLELEENAVELTLALLRLHDNYDLPGFDTQRQDALTALVACAPEKVALTLTEQFFTNQYAIAQRIAMLCALALGARELAGLPVPSQQQQQQRVAAAAFPSKMLPPALHRRYAGTDEVQRLVRDISARTLADAPGADAAVAAPVVRSRELRMGRLGSTRVTPRAAPAVHAPTFAALAPAHFIMPLVNHMWRHLRSGGGGVGTGIVLTPVVLAQYLGTLAVLLHAARHAPAYLGVLAPAAVELVLALGGRRAEGEEGEGDAEADAAVLVAALETLLVVLEACVALDGGRVLGLEHTVLLLAVGEWAGEVVRALGKGRRVSGSGGAVEERVVGAAVGVVERVEKVRERWGRSMVGM